ncbi:MAG TPA: hypothetical protein VJR92_12480 [Gemmatimonadaceae bacterium]|nr:hypothetical protein [Gemmatimonadaceae bacterium]
MTPKDAVVRGHVLVNGIGVLGAAAAVIGTYVAGVPATWSLRILLGAAVWWVWWSFSIARWRDWVEAQGLRPDDVQPIAENSLLIWERGSFFERTEFKRRNGRRGW